MKKFLLALIALVAVFGFASCSCGEEAEIAVVTDVGQLNDGGFNQGTYEGAVAFAEATGKTYKYYQPANGSDATDADRVAAMNLAIENGAKVIVTPGFLQAAAIETVATANPDVKFVFVDGWAIGLDNVTAISYKEQESGYFAGYAAVKDGYTKLGGTFGGGGTNAACNRFAYGYVQGIKAAAATLADGAVTVKISFKYGSSFSASSNLAQQINGWYVNGTEVVFSCGGSMLQSVKNAAALNDNKKIIGVDVDQSGEGTNVITSAVKGLSVSVKTILEKWNDGKWDAELKNTCSVLGAKENSTGLPTATGSWRFTNFTVENYTELFNKVVDGTITIDDTIPSGGVDNVAFWDALDDTKVDITWE